MQFNRDENGVMHPLPKKSVDTGMGLERISAILQHVHSNYEIDLFVHLIAAAKNAVDQAGGCNCDLNSPSLKVIADHVRACSFTITDGVIPGNAGRGYVLRRITRRAIRHGYKLGARSPFFFSIVKSLVQEMGSAYPELVQNEEKITDVIRMEEERFFQTIANGMEILENAIANIDSSGPSQILDGEIAFKLHDTFGFPLDLTADVCRERNVQVDEAGFEKCMQHQREQARAAGKFKVNQGLEYQGPATNFIGYENLHSEQSSVLALYIDGSSVNEISSGDDAVIVLDQTPFYAESGGQVGDCGEMRNPQFLLQVEDTLKIQADVFGHHGKVLEGSLKVGDKVQTKVDLFSRQAIMRNHSATHLLHKALREVLGAHVQQKGSLVDPQKTRFDFTHSSPVTDAELEKIEQIVNAEILANQATSAKSMSIDDAQKTGAMMLFGEKYGDVVRVLEIGSSKELCGGTHVHRTGDIGLFKVIAESGVAAGIRRIEAISGNLSLARMQKIETQLQTAAQILKSTPDDLENRVQQLLDQLREVEKELEKSQSKLAASQGDELMTKAALVKGIQVLATQFDVSDSKVLRETVDQLKNKLKSAVIVLGSKQDGKVQLIAGVTPDLISKLKAGELVNFVANQVGGKGGGKPDLAMAGGTEPENLSAALNSVMSYVEGKL